MSRRDEVLDRVREYSQKGLTIPFKLRGGPFSGTAGDFHYCFEGEDDLLHLLVERRDGESLGLEETKLLAQFLLPQVPEAQVWFRPGERSHHYYLGHDLLLQDSE